MAGHSMGAARALQEAGERERALDPHYYYQYQCGSCGELFDSSHQLVNHACAGRWNSSRRA